MICRVICSLLLGYLGVAVFEVEAQALPFKRPYEISTRNGHKCVLPFYYKGVMHNGCTKEDKNTMWCPITEECADNRIEDCKKWKENQNWDRCVLPVRIVGDRAELKFRNEWGGICGLPFNDEAAAVVCKDAGYDGGVVKRYNTEDKSYTDPVWLVNVHCQGDESRITDCNVDFISYKNWCEPINGAVPYANVNCYDCKKGSCLNGGVCYKSSNENKGKCNCASGFKGHRCEEMKICGDKLEERKELVCGPLRRRQKRSVDDLFLSEAAAKTMVVSRKKRGIDDNIHNECCNEYCSLGEVEEYCEKTEHHQKEYISSAEVD